MLPTEATTTDLAKLFGATVQHINDLARKGIIKRSGQGRFDLKESVRGWAKHREAQALTKSGGAGSYQQAKTRRANADAKKSEIDLAERMGQLVDAEATERVLASVLGIIRQRILALPSRIAPRIFRLTTATESEALLKHEVHAVLQYVADLDVEKLISMAYTKAAARGTGNGTATASSEPSQ